MSKETKFGYGFLLVGIGLPYLIDKTLGLSYAIVISVACVVIGGILLWAGHRHKDGESQPPQKIWKVLTFLASLSTLVALISFGILRIMPKPESPKSETVKQNDPKPEEPKGEESKKEPPKVDHPPSTGKKSPAKGMGKSESPAFAVAEEVSILSVGGNKYGTRFWLRTPTPNGCIISQAQAALYVRIDNLRPYPVTIVSYSIEAIKPLIRISTWNRSIFGINPPGQSFYGATKAGEVVPATQGSGLFAMARTPSENLNFSMRCYLKWIPLMSR